MALVTVLVDHPCGHLGRKDMKHSCGDGRVVDEKLTETMLVVLDKWEAFVKSLTEEELVELLAVTIGPEIIVEAISAHAYERGLRDGALSTP